MRRVDGIIDAVVEVSEDTEFAGIVRGELNVKRNVHVILSGIVEADVRLGDGAVVETPGLFSGTIRRS